MVAIERAGVPEHRFGTPASLVRVAGLGVVSGAAAQGAAALEGQLLELTALAGIWAAIAVLLGVLAPSLRVAAARSALFLLVAVVAFYAVGWVVNDDLAPLPLIAFWLAGAVVGGPVMGILGRLSSRPGRSGSVSLAVIVALLLGEAARLLLMQGFPPRSWLPVAFDVVAGGAFLWFVPADSRHRTEALLLLPVFLLVAAALFVIVLPWLIGLALG